MKDELSIDKDILDKAFNIFKQNFDKTYGGFKNSRNKSVSNRK